MVNKISDTTLASFGAGFTSTIFGHPLDLLRMRILFGNSIAFSNLNKGIKYSLIVSALKSGLTWPIQESLQKKLDVHNIEGLRAKILSGGIASALPNLIFSPFNIVRVHLLRDNSKYTPFQIAKMIYAGSGFRGFYKAISTTSIRDGSWGIVYFTSEENLRTKIKKLSPDKHQMTINFQASVYASTLATATTAWIDAVRLHLINADKVRYTSYREIFKKALAPSKANFLATSIGVIRVIISTAVSRVAFDFFNRSVNP